MKTIAIIVVAVGTLMAAAPAANAKGCLKGAAVGAVAGHFMHHHAVLGAVAGCVVGHHMAVNKEQQEKPSRNNSNCSTQTPQGH